MGVRLSEDAADFIKFKLLPLAASRYMSMPKEPSFAPVLTPTWNKLELDWPRSCCACHDCEGNECVILNNDTICQRCRKSLGLKNMKTIGSKRHAEEQ